MEPQDGIKFAVSDVIDGEPVSPTSVPLALIAEFAEEVQQFLRGSAKDVKPSDLRVEVAKGSLAFKLPTTFEPSQKLRSDLGKLAIRPDSLDAIDPRRAEIVLKWQRRARSDTHRQYSIAQVAANDPILIDFESKFEFGSTATWVKVEKYLLVEIFNMGGATKPNIHARTADGQKHKISATAEQISLQKLNLLYRPTVLHVRAEQSIVTDQLRNLVLLSFEAYSPSMEQADRELLSKISEKAWSDVADHVEWVRRLRGS
jgi:hypothetical protein